MKEKKDFSELLALMIIFFLSASAFFIFIDLKLTVFCFIGFLASGFTLFLEKKKILLLKESEMTEEKDSDFFEKDYPECEVTEETRKITLEVLKKGRWVDGD